MHLFTGHSETPLRQKRHFPDEPILSVVDVRAKLNDYAFTESVESIVHRLDTHKYLFSKSALEKITKDQILYWYSTPAKVAQQLLIANKCVYMDDNDDDNRLLRVAKETRLKDKPDTVQDQILRDKQQFFSKGMEIIDEDSATLKKYMESEVNKQQHLYNLTQLYNRVKGHHGSARGPLDLTKTVKRTLDQKTLQTIKEFYTKLNSEFTSLQKRIQEQLQITENILRQEEETRLQVEASLRAQRKAIDQRLLSKDVFTIPSPLLTCLKDLHYSVGMPPALGEETHRFMYPLQDNALNEPSSPGRSATNRIKNRTKQAKLKCPDELKQDLQPHDYLMLMSLERSDLLQATTSYFQEKGTREPTTKNLSQLVTDTIYQRIRHYMKEEYENLHLIPNMMRQNNMTFPGTKEANIAMLPVEFFCNAFMKKFPNATYTITADRFAHNGCLGKITIDLMYPLIGDSVSIEDKRSILQININGSSKNYTTTNIHQINTALMEIAKKLNLNIDPPYEDFSTSMKRASKPTKHDVKTHIERMMTRLESISEKEEPTLHQLISRIKSYTS